MKQLKDVKHFILGCGQFVVKKIRNSTHQTKSDSRVERMLFKKAKLCNFPVKISMFCLKKLIDIKIEKCENLTPLLKCLCKFPT